jgi:hypothetical protein
VSSQSPVLLFDGESEGRGEGGGDATHSECLNLLPSQCSEEEEVISRGYTASRVRRWMGSRRGERGEERGVRRGRGRRQMRGSELFEDRALPSHTSTAQITLLSLLHMNRTHPLFGAYLGLVV